jgi:ribosomal protein S18 acetylase RimI-like enzyme
LVFKRASKDQLQDVLNLFASTSALLKNKGLSQWSYWADPPLEKIQWVSDGFEKGEFHFVYDDQNDWLGIFRLLEIDTIYWDEKGLEKGVRYIHSLVVTPNYSGKGIGALILQNLIGNLAKKGVAKLRLDCDSSNSHLCSYYEGQGFTKVGEKKTAYSINNLYEMLL